MTLLLVEISSCVRRRRKAVVEYVPGMLAFGRPRKDDQDFKAIHGFLASFLETHLLYTSPCLKTKQNTSSPK